MKNAHNKVAEQSNAFSTGNGGGNFERNVQTMFLLALLVDGFSPVLETQVERVEFQARHMGFAVDDLIVESSNKSKLLCQIKHSISITENDNIFQEVVNAAWHDFNSQQFNVLSDKIALISSSVAKDSIQALQYIHEHALVSLSADDFVDRINLKLFTNGKARNKFDIIKGCLQKANHDQAVSNDNLWKFWKCFTLLVFDLDYRHSINRILAQSLIHCKTDKDAKLVWSRLADYCGNQNPNAASITRENIPTDILELFGLKTASAEMPITTATFTPSTIWAMIALIGCWNENNKNDIQAIEKITGKNYTEIQSVCRELVLSTPENLNLYNGVWKVRNRKAVIDRVKDFYFDETIKSAFGTVENYLKEITGQITAEGKFNIMIPPSGRFSNSDGFREGVIEGLCILCNGVTLKNCADNLLNIESQKLVRNVISGATWAEIISMSDVLQYLAEMDPLTYLKSLEMAIHSNPREIEKLFPQKRNSFSDDRNFITSILFTLQDLAWDDEYIVQCIRCLGELESLNYEQTNWANTPINTIVEILMPIRPQTYASVEKQKNAVQALKVDNEELCWNVLMKLLPQSGTIVVSGNLKPKYLKVSPPEQIGLEEGNQKILFQHYIHEAILLAESNYKRVTQLLEHSDYMETDDIANLLNKICDAAARWNDEERCNTWIKLCEIKYQVTMNNEDVQPTTEIFMQLCNTIDKLCPQNISYRHRRLFLSHLNEFQLKENGWKEQDKSKQNAIEEIYRERGLNEVIAFGKSVDKLREVGGYLGRILNVSELESTFEEYRKGIDAEFYSDLVNVFFRIRGIAVVHEIESLKTESPEFLVRLLKDAPFTQELIDIIPEYLHEKDYLFWESVYVPPYYKGSHEYKVDDVVNKLLRYNRADAAVYVVGNSVEEGAVEDELLYKMLIKAPQDAKGKGVDRYSVCEIIRYLQDSGKIGIDRLSDIEYIYLPWLDENASARPRAINYRLANTPEYFCGLMEKAYKKRNEVPSHKQLSKGESERIFRMIHCYKIIPGTDWEENFHADIFKTWLSKVKTWAKENDRYEVSMQTIGEGFSYAKFNQENVIDDTIMKELNKPENEEIRKGYHIGIVNQRGVYWVDPEGKQEMKLAQKFSQRAKAAEKLGYSRFSELLNDIARDYVSEAKENAKRYNSSDE